MRLSVCVVTYNHQDFIEQAILSILDQDAGFDFEIVAGEDCSTDATPAILKRLEAAHPGRLKVIYREANIGAAQNFSRTIKACTGEYLAYLEGDDFWTSKDKLRLQVEFLDKHQDAAFCFHRTRALNVESPESEFVLPPSDPPEFSGIDFLMHDSSPIALHTVVARRALLAGMDEWLDGLSLGDWPFCMMLATKGRIGYIAQEMSRYRVHAGGNWSRMKVSLQLIYIIQMLNRVSRLLGENERPLVEARKSAVAKWWAGQLLVNEPDSLPSVIDDLNRIGDNDISAYLLSKVAERGQHIQRTLLWREKQLLAKDAAPVKKAVVGRETSLPGNRPPHGALRHKKWLSRFRPW